MNLIITRLHQKMQFQRSIPIYAILIVIDTKTFEKKKNASTILLAEADTITRGNTICQLQRRILKAGTVCFAIRVIPYNSTLGQEKLIGFVVCVIPCITHNSAHGSFYERNITHIFFLFHSGYFLLIFSLLSFSIVVMSS